MLGTKVLGKLPETPRGQQDAGRVQPGLRAYVMRDKPLLHLAETLNLRGKMV